MVMSNILHSLEFSLIRMTSTHKLAGVPQFGNPILKETQKIDLDADLPLNSTEGLPQDHF